MAAMAFDPDQLQIVLYPDPVLRRRARPIERIDTLVRRVAHRMLELMHAAPGVGLAAPQVGLPWRMFVASPTTQTEDDTVFINPRVVAASRAVADVDEGCLSLPDVTVNVRRPLAVRIEAIGLDGRPFTLEGRDLIARIWQHELDHLNGVLIIDRAPPGDRLANQRILREMEQAFRPASAATAPPPPSRESAASSAAGISPGTEAEPTPGQGSMTRGTGQQGTGHPTGGGGAGELR